MATISLCPPSSSKLVLGALAPLARSVGIASAWTGSAPAPTLEGAPRAARSPRRLAPPPSLWDRAASALAELFPAIVLAVPKSKISHSRKSMRSANKGLRNKSNFCNCPACGSPKLLHHTCPVCYSQINRRWKSEARAAAGGQGAAEHEVVIRHET